jgi:DNA-directed RNA polymerase subunit RPC12/RpoP
VDRLRETGLIVRLAFGDLLLLQPEVLDNYASALINTARQQPDGFGCIGEDEVLAGKFEVPKEERLGSKAQEKLLLIAMVQDLLAHQIALREPGEQGMMLVFPSQFTRENPHLPEPEGKAVRFEFAGPVTSIYTTLAVRLSQSGTFTHKELWRNAVTYRPADGAGECGFFLQEVDEGHGRLTIFHAEATGVRMRELFEAFVENHLRTHALAESVTSRRVVVCADCKTPVSDIVLERVLARGREAIECQVCGATIAVKAVPAGAVLSKTAEDVREMDREADKNRGLAEATAILKGKIERGDFDVFLCHRSPDKPAVKKIGEALKERGILPWLDEWEIKPGERWQDVLQKQIKSIKAVIVCLSDTDIARYQQLELDGFVAEFVDRSLPVIPVILEGTIGEPKKPPFLAGFHAVDFRKSDPDPVEQLLWGITGNRGDGRDGGRISPDA